MMENLRPPSDGESEGKPNGELHGIMGLGLMVWHKVPTRFIMEQAQVDLSLGWVRRRIPKACKVLATNFYGRIPLILF